ncbi:MAG TPA: N-acetylmuramoyl-L-alanine amidase, partial [Rubricoccaceae bacterium]
MSSARWTAAVLAAALASAGCASSAPPPPPPVVSAPAPRPVRPAPPLRAPLPEIETGEPHPAAVASQALVRPLDPPAVPTRGLAGRHVAVWPSHGLYYEASRGGWEWQRAHLFTTIEDVLPFAFVQPYLAPMLERAGAVVLMPRERDTQTDEAVVDLDAGATRGSVEESGDWRPGGVGFAHRPPVRDRENPFAEGTARLATTALVPTAQTTWTPEIAAPGEYAVTVAYTSAPDRATDARYTVVHAGGTTRVAVNQTVGGGTWVRLGQFRFEPGRARVTLTNESATPGRTVSADAVRFGGGMGSVERGGTTSGQPRWLEAGRYYEQFAGFPPVVYNHEGGSDDYKDDYQSRGEWVNFLRGAPFGPTDHAELPGLRVPVDVALALHTDAGQTTDSTAVGTLAIYHTRGMDGSALFPDGRARTLSRDVAERVQNQIVSDLRALYDPLWTEREARNRNYSEAARPNVPSVLVELLAHQNLTDMRFALDPRFRSDVSRAVYKGVGRFLARQSLATFVVQPLSVTHLSVVNDPAGNVHVRWQPQVDPVEPSARADRYVVYTRRGEGGWDRGRLVDEPEAVLSPTPPGEVLSIRVSAVNAGGESAPSEVLSVGRAGDARPPVLVVAGFDRVAAPEAVESAGAAGFRGDDGVPDGVELSYSGDQTEFDPARPYVDDDRPGHGASRGDAVGQLVAGNTHDFVAVHGRALLAAGRSFVSASDEAVEEGTVPLADFPTVDLLLGEERTTAAPGWRPVRPPDFEALPSEMRARIEAYLASG